MGEKPLQLRSTITAADGTRLARLYRENRALTAIEDVPPRLIEAVLAAEDSRFYTHEGYDLRSIARAAIVNLRAGEFAQGGSTITQQYVKNTYFTDPAQTLKRKARELRLAMEVERRYSKDEILERYLNTVYFGEGAYGIEAAAETFFGTSASGLTLNQSALLAGLIKSPANYDPREHPSAAATRRNYVLERMAALADISEARAARSAVAPLDVTPAPPRYALREPYFVEAVTREVTSDVRLGTTEARRERILWEGGLRVNTTLVPRLQRAAENAVDSVLNQPGDPAAAVVAIRPRTGHIVAMVGGRDWSLSQVNLALGVEGGGSGRQPGSSFKPIVAATALESGLTLDETYESGPARFTFPDDSTWTVNNAEGISYGPMTLHDALVHSVNGVYARLAIDLGAGQIASQAELMGVGADLPAYPSIALGSAEVSVLDMAAAYATLANRGTAVEPTTIRSIKLATGEVFTPDQEIAPQAVAPGTAYLVTKALQDVIRDGTGRAAYIGRPAAGKTGTTNDYADAWFVGYTPNLVAAVWVGYPEGRIPMTSVHGVRVLGGTFPASIWRAFMLASLSGSPPSRFTIPSSEVVSVLIDPASGLLAAPWCPGRAQTMLRQLVPTEYCPQPPPPPVPIAPVAPTPAPSPSDTPAPEVSPSATPSPDSEGGRNAPGAPPATPAPSPSPDPAGEPSQGKKGPPSPGPGGAPTPAPSATPSPTPTHSTKRND